MSDQNRWWMMIRKTGPRPEDVLTTSHMEGLGQLRRQYITNLVLSVALMTVMGALLGLLTRSADHPAWAWFGGVMMILGMATSGWMTGSAYGYYRAFLDLSQAKIKISVIDVEDMMPDE